MSSPYLPFTLFSVSSSSTQATFSTDPFSVFDCMHMAPDCCTVEDLHFFPSDATAYASCLQLMMQPQGKWVQCLDKTNTGVTVVASSVSRKLSDSKGRLWKPTTCWTTMWICKGRELQTYASNAFFTPPGLSPKHAAPDPFSWPLHCLRARNSASGLTPPALVMGYWPISEAPDGTGLWRFTLLSAQFVPATSSGLHQGSTVHNVKNATGKTGRCLWKLNLSLQMALCHIPGLSPPSRPACQSRVPTCHLPTGIPHGGLNKSLFCPLSSLFTSDCASPPFLLGMGVSSFPGRNGVERREEQQKIGEKIIITTTIPSLKKNNYLPLWTLPGIAMKENTRGYDRCSKTKYLTPQTVPSPILILKAEAFGIKGFSEDRRYPSTTLLQVRL